VQQERRNAIIIAVLLCALVSLAMVAWALALILLIPWLFSPMMSSQ
jgi:multisubunit Na+/H+ antiporter MnhG subunit